MWRYIMAVFLAAISVAAAQDTTRVMTYNTLSYSAPSSRDIYFQAVIDSIAPDILVVEEIDGAASVQGFLNNILNPLTVQFAAGALIDGPGSDNAIFYRTSKFSFVSNTAIPTSARDLNEFVLVHNLSGDTLRLYAVHLNSGDAQVRAAQADSLRQVTDALPPNTHYLVLGDFNLSGSDESAFQKLLDQSAGGYVSDPLNLIGDWEQAQFAPYHTQSTRTRSFGGGAFNGLDERLDLCLFSPEIEADGRINYIPGSYTTFGNDGLHYADSINALPNLAVSDSIANALHQASDHLPVFVDLVFTNPAPPYVLTTNTVGGGSISISPSGGSYYTPTQVTLTAQPDPGYVFAGWQGDLQGNANPAALMMNIDRSVTAVFIQPGSGPITLEETVTGSSYDSSSIATGANLSAVAGDLYLAAFSTRGNIAVSTVSGLGLHWTRLGARCGARGQTRTEVWMAQGAPEAAGTVSAIFADVPLNAVVAVTRYSGVALSDPVGNLITGNTNGLDGNCSGGNDSDTYSFNFTTTASNALVYGAIGIRHRTHTPGVWYTERVEFASGDGGDKAGVAVQDRTVAAPTTILFNGTLNSAVDWSLVALELRPIASYYTLTIQTSGAGSVSLDPLGGTYPAGTEVTLTATPDAGYFWGGWSGDTTATTNPLLLPMNGNRQLTATFLPVQPLTVQAKAFLAGPFQADTMRTDLRQIGSLPLSQPYSGSPWNYNGNESVTAIPPNVVDWVLIKLRSSSEASSEFAGRACFLTSSGSIIDTSGNAAVAFDSIAYGNYYIVLYHHNHLAIMSDTTQALDNASPLYDFSTAQSQAYGTDPMVQLGAGSIFGMIPGDGNADQTVNDADREAVWRLLNGTDWSYGKQADYNLDGSIDVRDLNLYWRLGNSRSSQVP